jgi:hypothetical protein
MNDSKSESLDADDIRRLMSVIRSRMSTEAAGVKQGARELTDWRFYVEQFGKPLLGVCAVLGYFAVPRKVQVVRPDEDMVARLIEKGKVVVQSNIPPVRKAGLLDGAFNNLSRLAIRAGVAYAGQRIATMLKAQMPPSPPQQEYPQEYHP